MTTNPFQLEPSHVHVWQAALDCSPEIVESFTQILDADEISRAARFHFARDRGRFIAARGILRKLLARYLGREACELKFLYGPRGKPSLEPRDAITAIRFNISHSQGLGILAFSRISELGVDVEQVRIINAEEIAERFFSPEELAELLALPRDARTEGFFRCWTRKEAYVKALGDGLLIPLNSFSVSLTPGRQATLKSADSDTWSLYSFDPVDGFVAAVVAAGPDVKVSHWEWPTESTAE